MKNLLKKKMNKKGFTLAELLIVVAIIAVLVAISIPIFTGQLEKAREATDAANIRAAYAEVMVAGLNEDKSNYTKDVTATQKDGSDWANTSIQDIGGIKIADIDPSTTGWTVEFNPSTEAVTITAK
ncbi:MAG: prepilin-type N-terminal cleavage/methylation domain-containing protein [Eubacteriales bacterium]|nr:prepilin-type N-terminal cleavage/methylation domain-containing protein [Eubacteriales bacterium]